MTEGTSSSAGSLSLTTMSKSVDDDARERYREDHGETAEDDPDQGNRDEDDKWREAYRVPEDTGNDEVVLK